MPRRVAVVTGSRAEYGLIRPIMVALQNSSGYTLQVIVTASHLSPEFGLTYKRIEDDGFQIDWKVESLLSSDSAVGVAKSIGVGVMGFADALYSLKPDLLVVPADRYEALSAINAALVARIPVAHFFGGDVTEGAYDECIRHALTKMSHLHFTTNSESTRRVVQMGEDSAKVFTVGNPGLDGLNKIKLIDWTELAPVLGHDLSAVATVILLVFHPVTLDAGLAAQQFGEVLAALKSFCSRRQLLDTAVVAIHPNADNEGRNLIQMLAAFEANNAHHIKMVQAVSLERDSYLSILGRCHLMLGNSSSGIYEAAVMHTPTVDVGDRARNFFSQKSRSIPTAHAEGLGQSGGA